MSVWVIGSIAYLAVLLFAFALAQVASVPDQADSPADSAFEQSDRASTASTRVAGGN